MALTQIESNEMASNSATRPSASRRIVLGIVVVSILACLTYFTFNETWFKPRSVGLRAQAELDKFFRDHSIDGYVSVIFYDERIRFFSDNLSLQEVEGMIPIMRKIYWLRLVDFQRTNVTPNEIAKIREELAPVLVVGKDEGE